MAGKKNIDFVSRAGTPVPVPQLDEVLWSSGAWQICRAAAKQVGVFSAVTVYHWKLSATRANECDVRISALLTAPGILLVGGKPMDMPGYVRVALRQTLVPFIHEEEPRTTILDRTSFR